MVKLQNKTESGDSVKTRIEKLLEETEPANGLKHDGGGETTDVAAKNKDPATSQKEATDDENDALRMLSSEVGVKRLIGDDAVEVGTLPFDVHFRSYLGHC